MLIKVKDHREFEVSEDTLQEMKDAIQVQSGLLTELEALRSRMTTAFADTDGLSENHLQVGDLVLQQISEVFEKTIQEHQHGLDELFDLYNGIK